MTDKKQQENFRSVDFMRQARAELTKEYFTDKKKYLESLRQTMKDFRGLACAKGSLRLLF